MKKILLLSAIVGSLFPLLGCSPKPVTLNGSLVVLGRSKSAVWGYAARNDFGQKCDSLMATVNDDKDDREIKSIKSGSPVSVKDSTGKIVASGTLGEGTIQDLTYSGACVFPLSISNVPSSEFYTIEVEEYKSVALPLKAFQSKDWRLQISASSPTISDGSNLSPATEQEIASRKSSLELAISLAELEKADEESKRDLDIAMTCHYQWRLYNEFHGESMSKDCRERFIKEKGKTPEAVKAEEDRALGL